MPRERGYRVEWPTLVLLAVTYVVWATGTLLWDQSALLSVLLTGIAIAQHSSLQHEALHGHPFRNAAVNEALVFPALAIFLPYRRFRDTHLQHHFDPALTDPYDDPESHYLDPQVWERLSRPMQKLLRLNNTLAGRIVLGPAIGMFAFLQGDIGRMRQGDQAVKEAWMMHVPGLVMVLVWLVLFGAMPIWAYLLAVYLGFSLLRIRTYLEHRAHDSFRARTVVVEDRGPLALLFLNNNYHVVHHMHPQVPWYDLPALYHARRDHFLRRNDGYVYRNYMEIFAKYLWRAKDAVPHPIWPVKKSGKPEDT